MDHRAEHFHNNKDKEKTREKLDDGLCRPGSLQTAREHTTPGRPSPARSTRWEPLVPVAGACVPNVVATPPLDALARWSRPPVSHTLASPRGSTARRTDP